MNREETKEARKVMQHYEEGGEVEFTLSGMDGWMQVGGPFWD